MFSLDSLKNFCVLQSTVAFLHATVQTFTLCPSVLEPKLNVFLFKFWKLLSIGKSV
jgi:hypothetical protein